MFRSPAPRLPRNPSEYTLLPITISPGANPLRRRQYISLPERPDITVMNQLRLAIWETGARIKLDRHEVPHFSLAGRNQRDYFSAFVETAGRRIIAAPPLPGQRSEFGGRRRPEW